MRDEDETTAGRTCTWCLDVIRPGDSTSTNSAGGIMHADCDPEATRCPNCDAVLP